MHVLIQQIVEQISNKHGVQYLIKTTFLSNMTMVTIVSNYLNKEIHLKTGNQDKLILSKTDNLIGLITKTMFISQEGVFYISINTRGASKARFNVATPTYEARTRPLHVQHTYYRIIFKQNPFNIISREVQGCPSTDFRLK